MKYLKRNLKKSCKRSIFEVMLTLTGLFLFVLVYPVFPGSDQEKKPLIQGAGSGTNEDPYIVPQTQSNIKIDGKLEDHEWEKALKFNLLFESWPGDGNPAPLATECYLIYDRSNFYIGFRAFDPDPSKLCAVYYGRDSLWSDDFAAVFLDTFNNGGQAYGFRSNPYGVQWDDIRTRTVIVPGAGAPVPYDAVFRSKGRVYDWGYTVEMAIPFNQLRFRYSKAAQVWGFNARRIYWRGPLYDLDLIHVDRQNECLMCQYVKIKGFGGVKPGHNLEFVPALTAVRTDERPGFPAGDFEKQNQEIKPGVTARWGISSQLNLSAAANPDFSQVEADLLQLDINEPFALYYKEKRPFFYEGTDYFNTYLNALYTRTMHDPSWGIKLAGKAGRNTIGAYMVRDEATKLIFPGSYNSSSTTLDIANTTSVLRYQYDFGKNYTMGLLGANREGEGYFNRLAGVDSEIRLTRKDRIQFQFLASTTQYPGTTAREFAQEEEDFSGTALALKYIHDARNWFFAGEYQDLTNGFRADTGFIPQVNYRLRKLMAAHAWFGKPGSWLRRLVVRGEYSYTDDQEGNLIANGALLHIDYIGPGGLQSTLQLRKFREAYQQAEFDQMSVFFYQSIKLFGNFVFHIGAHLGDRIDYANIRPGNRVHLKPGIEFTPGKHLHLELSHTYERLDVDSGRVYTANISQLSGAYHFSVNTFFRAVLQYIDYDYNAANSIFPVEPRYKHLASQLLFSHQVNPRTVFFLGYSDNHYGSPDFVLTPKNRTFFAKLTYNLSL